MFRLLTYNILHGGRGRILPIAAVINSCAPDLVLVQEATDPATLESDRRSGRHGGVALLSTTVARLPEPPSGGVLEMDAAALLAARVHRGRAGGRRASRLRRPPERGARGVDRAPAGDGAARPAAHRRRASARLPRARRRLQHGGAGRAARLRAPAPAPAAAGVAERRPHQVADRTDRARRRLCGRVPAEARQRPRSHAAHRQPPHPIGLRLRARASSPIASPPARWFATPRPYVPPITFRWLRTC